MVRGMLAACAALLLLLAARAGAQEQTSPDQSPTEDQAEQNPAQAPPAQQPPTAQPDAQRLTVRGVVRSSAGGFVSHAMVQIEGDAEMGALTDGDGRFELPQVPAGPQIFTVSKPGFIDLPFGGTPAQTIEHGGDNTSVHPSGDHNVMVEAGMPELAFSLAPASAIDGRIQLTSGEPASSLGVQLARRTIADGLEVWQLQGQIRTRSDGNFHFGNLTEGVYAVFTTPQFTDEQNGDTNDDPDAQFATLLAQQRPVGLPSVYYADAREPGSLTAIPLTPGHDQQLTLTLAEEPFHKVRIPLAAAAGPPNSSNIQTFVDDPSGRSLSYPAALDPASNAIIAFLPDGSYRISVFQSAILRESRENTGMSILQQLKKRLVGQVELAVAGKPLTSKPLALLPQQFPIVQVNQLGGSSSSDTGNSSQTILAIGASGWLEDGMAMPFAHGPVAGPLEAEFVRPGTFWLHPQPSPKGVCEDSFTAAGASLAREPVQVEPGGTTPQLSLTLRHDCARLTLHLPPAAMVFAGEEPYYTAWTVPDFDFTHDLTPSILRPTSGDSIPLQDLTPGAYHVYVFPGPHPLAYHNRQALAALKGQAVQLEPNGSAELTVEVPER